VWPTEPPRPTEPIPNRNPECRIVYFGNRCVSTRCASRDRTASERFTDTFSYARLVNTAACCQPEDRRALGVDFSSTSAIRVCQPGPVAFQLAITSGGNRSDSTIDTRIFSSSERPVRREQAEERECVSAGTTDPPCPTEPRCKLKKRNGAAASRPSGNRTAALHRYLAWRLDQTDSERHQAPIRAFFTRAANSRWASACPSLTDHRSISSRSTTCCAATRTA